MATQYEEALTVDWADHAEIRHLLSRYCRAVDRRDRESLRSVFHADAVIDKGSDPWWRDDYVDDVMRRHADIPMASHQVTNIIMELLDRDTAMVESYGIAFERRVEPSGSFVDHTIRVRYGDVMARRDSAWRILSRRVVIDHVTSAPATEPTLLTEGRFVGSRGTEDPIQSMRQEELHRARTRI